MKKIPLILFVLNISGCFLFQEPLAYPVFSPSSTEITVEDEISISNPASDSDLYYTLDGTRPIPDESNTFLYSQPFQLDAGSWDLQAQAYKGSEIASLNTEKAYNVSSGEQLQQPTITPNGGSITTSNAVQITHPDSLALIRYTLDGSVPGNTSSLYTESLFLDPGIVTVRAIATRNGYPYSLASQATFEVTLNTQGDLIITEVLGGYYTNNTRQVELYNPGTDAVNLSNFSIRTLSREIDRDNGYPTAGIQSFSLPNYNVPPGGYAVIEAYYWDSGFSEAPGFFRIEENNTTMAYRASGGFVELLKGDESADFVRYGSDVSSAPSASGVFTGSAPAIPVGEPPSDGGSIITYTIYRNLNSLENPGYTDSDSAADWSDGFYSSMGAPNDILSWEDTDFDGIPDANEDEAGDTFAGLPLYQWGARVGVTDYFLHLGYMSDSTNGLVPKKEAVQLVVDSFAENSAQAVSDGNLIYPMALHVDAGDLYDQAPGMDPQDFDLSDSSHVIPFSQEMTISDLTLGVSTLRDTKNSTFDLQRRLIFFYGLFVEDIPLGSGDYAGGLGELPGNDFLVAARDPDSSDDFIIRSQAATLMHEFGHNLGLKHGGDVNDNYKPNYFSIMNYLYWTIPEENSTNVMLPFYRRIYDQDEGTDSHPYYEFLYDTDGYYRDSVIDFLFPSRILDIVTGDYTWEGTLLNVNFSHGYAGNLNESNLNETQGIPSYFGENVDWDRDGLANETSIEVDLNTSGSIETLSDHDDWGSLSTIYFQIPELAATRSPFLPTWTNVVGNDDHGVVVP